MISLCRTVPVVDMYRIKVKIIICVVDYPRTKPSSCANSVHLEEEQSPYQFSGFRYIKYYPTCHRLGDSSNQPRTSLTELEHQWLPWSVVSLKEASITRSIYNIKIMREEGTIINGIGLDGPHGCG